MTRSTEHPPPNLRVYIRDVRVVSVRNIIVLVRRLIRFKTILIRVYKLKGAQGELIFTLLSLFLW